MATGQPNTGSEQQAQLPATQQAQLPAETQQLMADVLGSIGTPTLHSFRGSKQEVWRQIAKVSTQPCLSYDDVKDSTVQIRDFYVHAVEFADERTGEVTGGIRTVLIPASGQPFACVSDGVAKDLAGIIRTFGLGPYDPPIDVKVVEVRTRKGFRTYRLVPAD